MWDLDFLSNYDFPREVLTMIKTGSQGFVIIHNYNLNSSFVICFLKGEEASGGVDGDGGSGSAGNNSRRQQQQASGEYL